LLDVHGRAIKEAVTVMLHHQTRGVDTKVTAKAAKPIVIDLFAQPEGVYRVAIDPLSYLQVGHFVSVLSSGQTRLTVTFPVDPAKVRAVVFPAYDDLSEESKRLLSASDNVLGFEGQFGADFFNRLDDIRRAGLMNIVAQCANTVFASARSVLSFLNRLIEVRGDRFFHPKRSEGNE